MFAEIITIGDEILIGQIVDTNSAFISQELNKIGVSVYQITSIQDDKQHILKALQEAENNADIIILTGGLGPTKDDITKNTLAEYFNDTLVRDTEVLDNIKQLWKKYSIEKLSQVNKDQALIPSKSEALMNRFGSAPGMWIEKGNKTFIALPGVPFEMKALVVNELIPKLRNHYKFPSIKHRTLITSGLGESALAERLENWENNLPSYIKLAYLPNLDAVRLRLTAKGQDMKVLEKAIETQIQLVLPLIKDIFIGYQEFDDSLEKLLGNALTTKNKTLSIAESCTGGAISQLLTANSGASAFFKGSVVCYSTQSKIDILGIDALLIKKHSVVSANVAEVMAQNIRQIYKTDFAIATTGNAGPSKGDSEEEVGTVFIAIATPNRVYSQKFMFGKPRFRVINKAVNKGLEMLYKEILKKQ